MKQDAQNIQEMRKCAQIQNKDTFLVLDFVQGFFLSSSKYCIYNEQPEVLD
jgi:hypothetical protein